MKNVTDIVVVLDRSGSMSSVAKDVCGGFDKFVEEQKKGQGRAFLTLVQFDTEYEFVYRGRDIKDVPKLELYPRGCTALLDAMGKAIVETGERFKTMQESERPDKVIFVIITDGEENSSKEYKKSQISEMIKHQTDIYKWEFVFLGANQDAIKEAASYGISAANTMNYKSTQNGYAAIFCSLSSNVGSMRNGSAKSMAFSKEDKEKAVKD
jgi:uncharacterized protein YegL